MNIITACSKLYLKGQPYVGVVIDDQNVRLTHLATYPVLGKLERARKKIPTSFFGILKAHVMAGKLHPDH